MPAHSAAATLSPRYPRGFRAFLATQFLGAFNDNAYKMTLILLAQQSARQGGANSATMIAWITALFLAPWLIFASWAGSTADRLPKNRVMRLAKFAEVAIMGIAAIGLALGSFPILLLCIFLMGAQSAFFSPAKYGILPETLQPEDLSRGNGLLEATTFAAILLGTSFGGLIFNISDGAAVLMGPWFIGIAILGVITSAFLPAAVAKSPGARINYNPFAGVWHTMRRHARDANLAAPIWGIAAFWTVAILLQMTLLQFLDAEMGLGPDATTIAMAVLAFSMGAGNILAARLSGRRVEIGLVPAGALLLSLTLCLFPSATGSFAFALALIAVAGLASGLFALPLNALVQRDAPEQSRGSVLAAQNFLSNGGMLLATPLFFLLTRQLDIAPSALLLLTGAALFGVATWLFLWLKAFIVRFIIWMLTHTLYRIRVVGVENIPRAGGALIVCNHVSYVDALLLSAVIPRPVRFLMLREWYAKPVIGPLARLMKAIPISQEPGQGGMKRAIELAARELRAGNLVCIFPEGQLTRTGNMTPFNRGMELIARRGEAPIIPAHLDNLWGSIFSFYGRRYFWKIPRALPYPAAVTIGAPMPTGTSAAAARQRVMDLGCEAFGKRPSLDENLLDGFLLSARHNWRRQAVSDTLGKSLTYGKLVTACAMLREPLRRAMQDAPRQTISDLRHPTLGIALPPGVGGIIANMTACMLGYIPIHLNFTASEESLRIAQQQSGFTHVLTSKLFLSKINVALPGEMIYIEDLLKRIDKRRAALTYILLSCLPFTLQRIICNPRPPAPNDVATVVFSSGSTGIPKGVMLTHRNLRANVEGIGQAFTITVDDRIAGVLPFFHSFGLTVTIWMPLLLGLRVDFHPNPLDAKGVGELIASRQSSIFLATPTFCQFYMKKLEREHFASLRGVIVGAEKMQPALAEAFMEKFGVKLYEGYGATELAPVCSVNAPDLELPGIHQICNKLGTVGQPIPGETVRVTPLDQDTAEDRLPPTYEMILPPGEVGMLWARGPNVMKGYLGDPKKTGDVLLNGWYKTGDLASLDADGFITLHGRLSRFSKIAGEMVPHERVEGIMQKAAGDAARVAVTGVRDEKKGERLVVLVEGDADREKLLEAARAAELPNLWLPRKEDFYAIAALPVLGSGKLDLKQLNILAAEKAGV